MKRLPMPDGLLLRAAVATVMFWGSPLWGPQSADAQIGGDLGVGRAGDLHIDRTQGGATGLISGRPRVSAQPPVAVPTPNAGLSPAQLADNITDSAARANAQARGQDAANAASRDNNRDRRNQNRNDRTGRGNENQDRPGDNNRRAGDLRAGQGRDRDQRNDARGDVDRRDIDWRDSDNRPNSDRRDSDARNDYRSDGNWRERTGDRQGRSGTRDDWGEGGYSGRYSRRNLGTFGQRYNGRYYTNPIVGRLVRQFPGATRILASRRYSVSGVFFHDRGTYYYYPEGSNASAVPVYGVSSSSIPNAGSTGLVEIEFGGFQQIEELTQILPIVMNDLCLDLHHNYSHNPRFMPVYHQAYQILQISKEVRRAADADDRDAVRRGLQRGDRLLHAVDRQTENWTRREQRQIGEMGIITKMQMVADLMHHAMYNAGIRLDSHDHEQIQN